MAQSANPRQWEHDQSRAPEYGATHKTDTPTEARQGVTGHNVNVVLIASTAAAIIAMFAIYGLFFAS